MIQPALFTGPTQHRVVLGDSRSGSFMTRPSRRDPLVTSRIMAAVKRRDTRPELRLRQALHAKGLRYRVDFRGAAGSPDIAFPKLRVAVFVDGDFWHGNASTRSARNIEEQFARWANAEFWTAKVRRNIERDRRADQQLRSSGWRVVRIWESDVLQDLNGCVSKVRAELGR